MISHAAVALLGLTGVIALWLPTAANMPSTIGYFWQHARFDAVLMLVAFGVPVLAGISGAIGRPGRTWQGPAALAAFTLAAVKLRIWKTIASIADGPLALTLMLVAALAGLLVCAAILIQAERAR